MAARDFYRRNLPHWQPACAEYFVTFRLINTIPESVIRNLQPMKNVSITKEKQRRAYQKYEHYLDSEQAGPTWLNKAEIAEIVAEALHHRDNEEYDLYAFCIMSNHVHLVFRLLDKIKVEFPVTKIMQNLKSFTALKANKILNREGSFWKSESWDHVIRNHRELDHTIRYVLSNPVKAGLADIWQDWKYSYCKPEFLGSGM